jgi:hypothetical protein
MKIAVCLSRQVRTGADVFFSLKNYIGELWDKCDFFVHTWDIETTSPHIPQLENISGINLVDGDALKKLYNSCLPKVMVVDDYLKIKSLHPQVEIAALFYSILQSNKLKTEWERRYNFKYDYVIQMRPDILFHNSKKLLDDLELVGYDNVVFADHHARNTYYKRLCLEDILWIAKSHVMDNVISFCEIRLHPDCFMGGLDWQTHHKLYLESAYGYTITKMNNNSCAIYHKTGYVHGHGIKNLLGTHYNVDQLEHLVQQNWKI